MSLISMLRGDSTQTTSDAALTTATQKLTAKQGAATVPAAQKGRAGGGGAQITVAARQAAAAKVDAKTPIATLRSETSAALKAGSPMSGFSNRALAVIALDDTGAFKGEQAFAAKAELRTRDRASLVATISASGLSAASLSSWISAQAEARTTMSSEEQALRGRL